MERSVTTSIKRNVTALNIHSKPRHYNNGNSQSDDQKFGQY